MKFIPCVAWVAKGKAVSTPHKLQLSPEELKQLVDETKELCQENDVEESEDEASNESEGEQEEITEQDNNEESDDDLDARYNLNDYDNNDDQNPIFTINDLAVHVDNHDDEYITDEESEGDIEDQEDFTIKDSDNLLIVGHVEDTSSVLEIYVYNHEEDAFYVHHDIVLPSYPLALAWLDFHPSDEKPGNYVAVGDMSPVIKIWDLDVVDVLEPDYTLGEVPKKKKAKMIKKAEMKYHSDAVISLSWNKNIRNLLASGSADSTVIVWDLEEGVGLNQLSFHSNKVQSIEWHPTESQFLLSGCVDGFLKFYDCRSEDEAKSWKIDGEIEKVCWNIGDSFKFLCSTDKGDIYSFDMRNDEADLSFKAHKEAVTGLDISPLRPDLLVSASMDRTCKIWDLKNSFKMIKSMKLKVGSIYTAKAAPDLDLTVAFGGNDKSNSLKVIDVLKENKDEKSNEDSTEVKNKSRDQLEINKKFNKRMNYGEHSRKIFTGAKFNSQNKINAENRINKRNVYGEHSRKIFTGAKFNSQNKIKSENTVNKRIVYGEKSNDSFKARKINAEEKFAGKQTNKRIIYARKTLARRGRKQRESQDVNAPLASLDQKMQLDDHDLEAKNQKIVLWEEKSKINSRQTLKLIKELFMMQMETPHQQVKKLTM